jgi:hypothetical protein
MVIQRQMLQKNLEFGMTRTRACSSGNFVKSLARDATASQCFGDCIDAINILNSIFYEITIIINYNTTIFFRRAP